MIFANPMGNGFGAASAAVKDLQTALAALAKQRGDSGFSPGTVDGNMRDEVVFALVYLLNKVSRSTPGVKDIFSLLNSIPKVGDALSIALQILGTSRAAMALAWSQLVPTDARTDIKNFVVENASKLATAVKVATLALGGESTSTFPGGRVTFQPSAITSPSGFPPGAVAVRDPVLNKFRILVKP